MGNRGRVGAVLARGRAPVILAFLLVGGAFLLRRDVAGAPAYSAPAGSALSNPQQIRAAFGRLPLSFEPNQGQSDSRVKFLAHGNGYGLYLTSSEAVLALPHLSKVSSKNQSRPVVEMQFGGANQSAQLAGSSLLPGRSNYFIGNDPSRWHRNIPQFSRVQYRDLYSGIDLDFYGKQGRLEYDFTVAPGADPSQIALDFKGTKNLQIAANGDLVLTLDDGDLRSGDLRSGELRFEAPHIYQTTSAGTQTVAGSFVLRSDSRVAFQIGAYDRSRALVIDPVLTFSTYLGGSGDESCTAITSAPAGFVPHCPAIAVDSASRVYVAGTTDSSGTFPVPSGTTPPTLNGVADIFLVRFNSNGSALDYTTYVGASGTQYPSGVGVDSGFNVYVTGTTNSQNFPTTTGAFQSGPSSAGTNHVFFSEFDSSGSVNLYSTYLFGTTGADSASDLAVDALGRAYIFGITSSSNFPTTPGALQTTFAPTNQFFFSKIDPSQTGTGSLLYSTFIGSTTSTGGTVTGGGIAVDSLFNVYLAGGTNITAMPIVNAYQGAYQGGADDVWAAKLQAPAINTQQYTPLYETYFGGSGDDIAYGVATDGTNTFITGSTNSPNLTIPSGTTAFQPCLDQPPPAIAPCTPPSAPAPSDAFVAKLGVPVISGTTQGTVPLNYFTYLGGTATDTGLSIATDTTSGNARVTGFTDGANFPVTGPSLGTGGGRDAFVARILTTTTTSGTTNTSTANILGGSGTDIGTSIAIDSALNDYVAGETASANFPLATPFQGSLSGPTDAFVTKLGPTVSLCFSPVIPPAACPSSSLATVSPSPVGVGNQVTFTYSIYNTGDPVARVLFTDTLSSNSTFVSASASPGTCPVSAQNFVVVCNLGTIPSSVITAGTPPTIAPAATVTVVESSTVPTIPGTSGFSINNSGNLLPLSNSTAQATATVNDFNVKVVGPNTQTVTAGAQATYQIQVTPTGGIPGSVSLSCGSGLPSGAVCTFVNNPIPSLNNGPQSRTLEISTQFRVTTPGSLFRPGPVYAFWFPVSGLAMLGAGVTRKRRLLLGLFFAVLLGTVALQAGCGSSSSTTSTTTGTPAGTYTIVVNATSVAVRSTAVQLTVN
jgi:uncharacterized repeat protein (TIGR01451 family)